MEYSGCLRTGAPWRDLPEKYPSYQTCHRLAISPVLAQVGRLQIIQSLEERKSIFIQVGLIALCVSIAIIIAVFRSGFFGENSYY